MKKQKDTFLLVCSLLLIAACLFGLFSCVKGFNEFLSIKEYKEHERDAGLAAIDTALDGISQLKENEAKYTSGVSTYNAGLASYYAGQQELAKGAADLAAGEASYAAGQQKLEAGKQQYAAGKAELEANTDAYNEGKKKLALAETVVGIGDAIGVDDPFGLKPQIADGKEQIQRYEDGQKQLVEAEAQIAQGEADLAAGRKELLAGYDKYNAGVNQLNAGAAQLADGKAQLSVFEEGAAQLAAGMDILLTTGPVYRHDGVTVAVKGVADRLGKDFSIWQLNDDGSVKVVNGCQYLNFDNCLKVCKAGQDFIADQTDDVTAELTSRAVLYLVSLIVCLLGTIAGIKGADAAFAPKRREGTAFLGMVTAAIAIGANIYGYIGHYTGYTYPLEDGTYSGSLQMIAIMVLALVAIIFAGVCYASFASFKKCVTDVDDSINSDTAQAVSGTEIPDTQVEVGTVVEAAPVVETPDTALSDDSREKLHKLEREEEELKQMLASLSSKINDIKHQAG